jgi:hypothetical protein
MSHESTVDQSSINQPTAALTPAQSRAQARLAELKRALQRQLRRKPKLHEKQLLDHAAAMQLRSEIAAFDPRATSNDLVRLSGAARRARQDFEHVCGLDQPQQREPTTLVAILREGARP